MRTALTSANRDEPDIVELRSDWVVGNDYITRDLFVQVNFHRLQSRRDGFFTLWVKVLELN